VEGVYGRFGIRIGIGVGILGHGVLRLPFSVSSLLSGLPGVLGLSLLLSLFSLPFLLRWEGGEWFPARSCRAASNGFLARSCRAVLSNGPLARSCRAVSSISYARSCRAQSPPLRALVSRCIKRVLCTLVSCPFEYLLCTLVSCRFEFVFSTLVSCPISFPFRAPVSRCIESLAGQLLASLGLVRNGPLQHR
jgi:hypothetical protein